MIHIKNINPIDKNELRERVRVATPVPNFCIDHFLEESFANRVADAYPTFEEAVKVGRSFAAVNEKGKVQVTDSAKFAEPIAELNRTLASPEFLELLSVCLRHAQPAWLTPNSLAAASTRPAREGTSTSMSTLTSSPSASCIAGLNILVYFNKGLEAGVRRQHRALGRRCEGLPPVVLADLQPLRRLRDQRDQLPRCHRRQVPRRQARKSFAAYYYTKEAPAHWTGVAHSTIFKARPDEILKGNVMMPLETAGRKLRSVLSGIKKKRSRADRIRRPETGRSPPVARFDRSGHRLRHNLAIDVDLGLVSRYQAFVRGGGLIAEPFEGGVPRGAGPGDPSFEPFPGQVVAAELAPGHRQEIMVERGSLTPSGAARADRSRASIAPAQSPARYRATPRVFQEGFVIGQDPDRFLGQGQGPSKGRGHRARWPGARPGR